MRSMLPSVSSCRVLAVSLVVIVSACGIDTEVPLFTAQTIPRPAGAPLPIHVGVLYEEAFGSYTHTREQSVAVDYVFPVGRASVAALDQVFPAVFRQATVLSAPPGASTAGPAVDALIRPSIEEFQYAHPFGKRRARARVTYRFDLSDASGAAIASWNVTGASTWTPPEESTAYVSPKSAASSTATAAISDAAANFAAGVRDIPELQRWLRQIGVGDGGPAASSVITEVLPGQLLIAAAPYVDDSRQNSTFGVDLLGYNILAVDATIRNDGARPLLIRYGDINLILAGADRVASTHSNEVFERTAVDAIIIPLPYTAILINNVVRYYDRMIKLEELRLKDARLAPGQSARGVVYFPLPDDARSALGNALLEFRVVDIGSGTCSAATAPLRDSSGLRPGAASGCAERPSRADSGRYIKAKSTPSIAPELRAKVDKYLWQNQARFETNLDNYIAKHVNQNVVKRPPKARMLSYEISEAGEQKVILKLIYAHGNQAKVEIRIFVLRWSGGHLAVLSHEDPEGT